MTLSPTTNTDTIGILARADFPRLLELLWEQAYAIKGPVVSEGSVRWQEIRSVDDLPVGWRDDQQPGRYRLTRTSSARYFDVVHGPESIKPHTFVSRQPLVTIERRATHPAVVPSAPPTPRVALLGVRACDLAALAMHDRIFLKDTFEDPYYRARRDHLLLIAVNCTRALETCFCAASNTGPSVTADCDLILTEDDDTFVVQAGSDAGERLVTQLPITPSTEARLAHDRQRIEACAASQQRHLPTAALPQALYDAHDHPQWDAVAARCLSCGNCTMVCPTCFCHTVEEQSDIAHQHTTRTRAWDSCFTAEHGYIHGKNIRPTIKDRYRMWLTHKFGTWIDQFGASGCVGCGRCLTWCPVGIDPTAELHQLCAPPTAAAEPASR